jgi:hypothetical protein
VRIPTTQYRRLIGSEKGRDYFNTSITLAALTLMCVFVWLLAIGGR